jgi:hypothetical protein
MATEKFANNAATTLAAAITTTNGTSITVTSETGFPAVQFRIIIDSEIMLVTTVATTTWTVARAQEGTTGATHLNGAPVTHILTAGGLAQTLTDTKSGLGDVVGPASSTDNAIARFDSTTGKLLQNSLAIVDDSGGVNIPSGQTYNINDSPHTHAYGAGDMTYAALLACQLTNEIKGWPPVVNTGDLDALLLWFRKVGTPTTAPTVTDTSVAGLTDNYELCLKVVADASGEGLSQTWTYADEPRVKAGRALSTLWAIWCVSGVGVTASLVSSDASHTDAAKVTAAAWTIVEVPNHTLAGTSCSVQLVADGAGTFYAVPLGANIGARGFPLAPRQLRYVSLSGNPPSIKTLTGIADEDTWTDIDLTASSSPLAARAQCAVRLADFNSSWQLFARSNGSSQAKGLNLLIAEMGAGVSDGWISGGNEFVITLDDGQIFEYLLDRTNGAGTCMGNDIYLRGYWEWA